MWAKLTLLCLLVSASQASTTPPVTGKVREYFVAAEEVSWDFSPRLPTDGVGDTWLAPGPERIGHVYQKAVYVEYTDSTFQVKKEVAQEWKHKGLLGPILRAQVGDKLEVHFLNRLPFNCSMHPHGVWYKKKDEGAFLEGVTGAGGVETNATRKYEWFVPERSGPGPEDPSSIMWLYHSHVDETMDTNTGLVGGIIISRAGQEVDAIGKPADVDKEFVLFFTVMNEGSSHFLRDNIILHTTVSDPDELIDDPDFEESNLMHSVNGRVFSNVEGLKASVGDSVRWYTMALGTEVDLHTIHWHAVTTIVGTHRTDSVTLLPAQMQTVDTEVDSAGSWCEPFPVLLLFCFVFC
jgi:FtsP/CotA-like multicopper oxidase with cupredoxin domain